MSACGGVSVLWRHTQVPMTVDCVHPVHRPWSRRKILATPANGTPPPPQISLRSYPAADTDVWRSQSRYRIYSKALLLGQGRLHPLTSVIAEDQHSYECRSGDSSSACVFTLHLEMRSVLQGPIKERGYWSSRPRWPAAALR